MKYNRLKFFGLILFSLIINASCSKDSIDINLETCSGCGTTSSGTDSSSGSSSNGSSSDGSSSGGSSSGGSSSDGSSTTKEDVLVSFRPFLLTASSTTTSTSGVSQIATGRNVSVYAYNSGELTKMVNYVSTSSGSLSPVSTGDNMVIPTGTYDFYFVGNNNSSSSVVPTFSLGKLESLSNGIDYISVADKGVVVTGAKDLTVTMAHACTQVVLAFASSGTTTSSTAVTLNTLNSSKISASTTRGATWNILTGAITPV